MNHPPLRPPSPSTTSEGLERLEGEDFLVLRQVDQLGPFLMSVVSHSDHWLFVSSRGGLTAGRRSPAGALFPYVTDDKLHLAHAHTGPLTTLRVTTALGPRVWQPFRTENDEAEVQRSLFKTPLSDRLVFEELHHGLGLRFRARWETSEAFGFVRTVSLTNLSAAPISLELADGLMDLMPAGVPPALQQGASCLVNAYTRADVDPSTRLGVFALQALIVDQPVPAESLRATTVACVGLEGARVLLSTHQLGALRRGLPLHEETRLTGRRGAYLVTAPLTLGPGETRRWRLLADVDRDHVQVEALRARLADPAALEAAVAADVEAGAAALRRTVASADAFQCTGDRPSVVHHQANVLFNVMRGGVFADGHRVAFPDFVRFVGERNHRLAERLQAPLDPGAEPTSISALTRWARASGDPDLLRLAREYLPLGFSRRHGDPSRPWNSFEIRLRDADGTPAYAYQGNWRDIFQNWEALCASYPDFLENVIVTFVNASTADGFNPYRLSRGGIDWEVPEEGNPWSAIGYWGDHQIVYLGRLLEALERTAPGRLAQLLPERWFVFADVPYRLGTAAELARDPRHTIRFDVEADRRAQARAAERGGDGKLLHTAEGELVRVSFLEKLLVPVLSKLANLVVGGGIWMNTQRPEWNDANNALVGNGLSVVTLCQLRRHLAFLQRLFGRAEGEAQLSASVATWLLDTRRIFEEHQAVLATPSATPEARRALLDALQLAFQRAREGRDSLGVAPPVTVQVAEAAALCGLAVRYLDHSLRANRRPDGLWHAYNLLTLTPEPRGAQVEPLYEMLEGQVAVLSSGVLTPEEAVGLLDALFASRLYRADQDSFLLYPERTLPGFLEKNRLPAAQVQQNPLLAALLSHGDGRLVARDVLGQVHFAGHLQTAADVRRAVLALEGDARFGALAAPQAEAVVALFEQVFDLKSFTGRSGTMYGYEGLGCIYWHMVSKLLLAVQEAHAEALAAGAAPAVVAGLARGYRRVRQGLGFNKPPEAFGAFPSDPYSHTPRHAGAQQPGMTGSVKEEILARWGELGVTVSEGHVRFAPTLLPSSEFLREPATWRWVDQAGAPRQRELSPGQLAFTWCQVPIIYQLGAQARHQVRWGSGAVQEAAGAQLDAAASRALLGRTAELAEVLITVPAAALFAAQETP